jgi:hypothetical protein
MNKSKAHCKGHFGPGGIKCNCCRPFSTVKETRIKINRALRRKNRQNIEKEVDGGELVE